MSEGRPRPIGLVELRLSGTPVGNTPQQDCLEAPDGVYPVRSARLVAPPKNNHSHTELSRTFHSNQLACSVGGTQGFESRAMKAVAGSSLRLPRILQYCKPIPERALSGTSPE